MKQLALAITMALLMTTAAHADNGWGLGAQYMV